MYIGRVNLCWTPYGAAQAGIQKTLIKYPRSRSFETAPPFAKASEGKQDMFRGNDILALFVQSRSI